MTKTQGYATLGAKKPLEPFTFERRELLQDDVSIDILYCGVCHSDVHQVRDEWAQSVYPMVPGHEIVGRVTAVGKDVKKFKVGDLAGVGCMVDSCRECGSCDKDLEQYCAGTVFTYNAPEKHTGKMTYGGYSKHIIVNKHFVLHISEKMASPEKLAAVAPLLCAGITTYSPMRHWQVSKGHKVGVVGLGGLGHMAVKWSHAFGAKTVLFTTSPNKTGDALRMGADEVVISKKANEMQLHAGSFDFIINTVAASHDLNPFLQLLKRDGTMCMIGVPDHPHPPVDTASLIFQRRSLAGSLIGGIKETQEMLDFAAKHDIVCDVEMIAMNEINQAFDRVVRSDVKYRFVIDMATLA
ncbi:MAG: NAD(P)-dependent alcohol dehydrogenase [Methylophilaceae bacterium]|nr:NAD(P)-dependent alcohol dehydrogenase [Methylophilaceae bacterium]